MRDLEDNISYGSKTTGRSVFKTNIFIHLIYFTGNNYGDFDNDHARHFIGAVNTYYYNYFNMAALNYIFICENFKNNKRDEWVSYYRSVLGKDMIIAISSYFYLQKEDNQHIWDSCVSAKFLSGVDYGPTETAFIQKYLYELI